MLRMLFRACCCLALTCLAAAPTRAEVPLKSPEGLLFLPGGALWVACYVSNQVLAYDTTQSPPAQFLAISKGLDGPTRLAAHGGKLYVANSIGNSITVYDLKSGAQIKALSLTGLGHPLGVAVDAIGNVYVANNQANDVAVYSSTGSLLGTVSGDGTGTTFDAPGVLAIYDGTLFVGIGGGATDSLRQYPLSGFLAKPLTPTLVLTEGISGPTGVAFTRQPRTVLVADYYSGFVTHYDLPHGHALPTITDKVYAPEGIAVDTSGNIYVADSAKNRIGVYSPAGVFKFSF